MKRRPHLIVFSVAGLSAESGLPTFGEPTGFGKESPFAGSVTLKPGKTTFKPSMIFTTRADVPAPRQNSTWLMRPLRNGRRGGVAEPACLPKASINCWNARRPSTWCIFTTTSTCFGENAPRYGLLHETVADLRAADTAIVIGTSGTVLPADRLFAHSKAYSILVNLEPGQQMDEGAFSERHYGRLPKPCPSFPAF
jgi:NAD-dependent SIR2 family protein deacetylase